MTHPCPNCQGTGKIKTEKPLTMTAMGTLEKDCDLCGGTGYLEEDLTPQVIERLDTIIELLKQIAGGK
jgi:DnaJ-class molecular chaperone